MGGNTKEMAKRGNYDFSGYATKAEVLCADGRVIGSNAFADCNGKTVPIFWNHQHNNEANILGHAELENRADGVYAYCYLNPHTREGRKAKADVQHGDITSMSIFANHLQEEANRVVHGDIKEVSLVAAGANPGALIDSVIMHSDGSYDVSEDEANITCGIDFDFVLAHSDDNVEVHNDDDDEDEEKEETTEVGNENEEVEAIPEEELEHDDMGDVEETISQMTPVEVFKMVRSALYTDPNNDELSHADEVEDEPVDEKDPNTKKYLDMISKMSPKEIFDLIQTALFTDPEKLKAQQKKEAPKQEAKEETKEAPIDNKEGEKTMKHSAGNYSVFDAADNANDAVLSHDDMNSLVTSAKNDAKNYGGSFREAFIAHADQDYGIGNIDLLFPDAKALNNEPELIKREDAWVADVLGSTTHTPFARIKTLFADITVDEARAKGYIKGTVKKEEFFALAKRETTPTTVYKKQKLDRDDIIDVTTVDIVNFLMREMRVMLNEEIARAILIGDGREASSEDKIDETHIRPVVSMEDLFTVKVQLSDEAAKDPALQIEEIAKAHKEYKGSGSPKFYTATGIHTNWLWTKDTIGRRLYSSDAELCTALRVSAIVDVPVMEDLTVTIDGVVYDVYGIKVNLKDYHVGTDKGGEINTLNQFDIDVNQQKYLMEARCSGTLVKYHAAEVFLHKHGSSSSTPSAGA